MSAFAVELNDRPVVTVSTDGLDLLDVQISGDRIGPELANLRVSGGSYPDGKPSTYLIWQDETPLEAGDRVSVTFLKEGRPSRAGQTIEQLYPNESPKPKRPFAPPEQMIREAMQMPKQHQALSFRVVGPNGTETDGTTTEDEHGFGFSVSWTCLRPEWARVALHTYTLQSLVDRQNGTYHARRRLQHGQGVVFTMAPNSTVERDARKSGARPSP
jgi:hypothetical protein